MPQGSIYAPEPARVLLAQIQEKYHPELSKGSILHRALAIYYKNAEYRDGATSAVDEHVMARDGARKVKVPRDTKKVKSDPAPVQKAQASSPASQSKGILRVPPVRSQVTGTQGA